MDLGRNEKCYCGSGKKYKKCCLFLDEQREELIKPRHISYVIKHPLDSKELFDVFESEKDEDDDGSYEKEDTKKEDPDLLSYEKHYACEEYEENTPVISKEEKQMIDQWWKEFKKTCYVDKDYQKSIEMIQSFSKLHPHLVSNLGLHEEAISSIEEDCLKENNYVIYIDFLKWFRAHFFDAYELRGAHNDLSLITYHLVEGNIEEIPKYFYFLHKYPDHDADCWSALIRLFKAFDQSELLYKLLKDFYPHLYYSKHIIIKQTFINPVLQHHYFKYLKRDYSSEDLDHIISDIKSISNKIPHMGMDTDRKHWKDFLDAFFDETYPKSFPTKKLEITKYYQKVICCFRCFLHEQRNLSWLLADFYSELILDYLNYPIDKNKRPKKPFIFEIKLLNKYTVDQFYDAIWHPENIVFS